MIKHIVMWKLKDTAEGNSKADNAKRIKTELESLKSIIKEIISIEVGINITIENGAYDVILNSEFESLDTLGAYQKHPAHIKVAEFIAKVREARVVVDYEK